MLDIRDTKVSIRSPLPTNNSQNRGGTKATWTYVESFRMYSPESNRISPKMCHRQQGIITIPHISKRVREKAPNVVQHLWDGRDLLYPLSDSLGFLLIVARRLLQLQTSSTNTFNSRNGKAGNSLHYSFVVMEENVSQESLVDFLSNPFEQEWITSQSLAARQAGKENVRFSQPLHRERQILLTSE